MLPAIEALAADLAAGRTIAIALTTAARARVWDAPRDAWAVPWHSAGVAPVALMLAGICGSDHRILALGQATEPVLAGVRG